MKQFVETVRIEKGIPRLLELHLARLQNTAFHYYGINLEIPNLPSLLLSELKDEIVKCRILYSDKIENIEFVTYEKRNIQKLKIVHDNNIDYIYKSTNRKPLDALLEQKGDADEIIIIKNGCVTDTSFSNLLFENEGGIFTPNSFLLNGVQRQNLIKSGLIQELTIREDDIWRFTKIHLINAMLLPAEIVVDINDVR